MSAVLKRNAKNKTIFFKLMNSAVFGENQTKCKKANQKRIIWCQNQTIVQ